MRVKNKGMIVGIDASLSCTGVACMKSDGTARVGVVKKPRIGDSAKDRIERCRYIVKDVVSFMPPTCAMVVIESYATCRQSNTANKLGELGGLLRWMLLRKCDQIIEVPPTRLKKFVTGKGNSQKSVMIKHVDKRWGFDTESDDEADAFGLARLGGCLLGYWEPENNAQREVIEAIRAGK